MRKTLPQVFMTLLCATFFINQSTAQQTRAIQGQLIRVTPKLADLNPDPTARNYNDVVRDVYGLLSMRGVERHMNDVHDPTGKPQNGDPALQRRIGGATGNTNRPDNTTSPDAIDVITQFDGMGFTNVAPADPTLCVGQNHVIQMINGSSGSYFRIYDKNGNPASAQTYLDQLTGAGFFGQGDPIALYDQLADRYVLSEFGNITGSGNPTHLIMCVSQTNNPTGAWYIYRFATPGIFPDYPKFGVWGNCYTATTNDFNTGGTAFLGCSLWAFDRTKMLIGDASATALQVQLTTPFVGSNRSLIPISHIGNTPPTANAPALFSFYNDDATTAITTDVDSISFISYLPNFATPANSVFTRLPSLVPAAFKGVVCGSRNCAPGCGGSSGYDVLDSRNMFPANWRRFPTYDAITICHTVDANAGVGTPKAGIRWYEFRNTGSGWTIYQQSTLGPDANFRYMPSMAMNSLGQICLGYNLSGAGACSSIFFTGRNSTDPLNTMTFEENAARCGSGYGTFANRWGDYNHMNVDPAPGQDSIFWFTAMYGQANWNTRILKLKLSPNLQYDARAETVSINVPGAIATGNPCAVASGPTSFTLCSPATTPYIIVRNRGTQTINTVNIKYSDNGNVTTVPQTGLTIAPGGAQQFTLATYNATLGLHNVKAWTEIPNGQADQNPGNDTAYATFTVINVPPLPISTNFVTTTFPPARFSIVNPNTNNTWVRNNNGNGNAGSAFIDNYNFNLTGQTDDIRTEAVAVPAGIDSVIVEFDLAHKNFPGFNDRLQVLASNDCGNTYLATSFDRSGATLATAGSSTANYTTPAAADWKRQRVAIGGAAVSTGSLVIAWRLTNGFGNNVFIDNINVTIKVDRDMRVTGVVRPTDVECTPNFVPQITVQNAGTQVINSYRVGYRLDNNAVQYSATITTPLAVGASNTVSMPAIATTAGNHNFCAFSDAASIVTSSGSGDQLPGNDSTCKPIFIRTLYNAPIVEGFEGTAFPSTDWAIVNPDNNNTWVRTNVGNASARSLFIDNFNFNLTGQTDDYRTPPINVAGADSLIVSFDFAHKNYPGFDDRLQVLASPTCGNSFLATSFDRSGAALATAGSSTANYTSPAPTDWVRHRVSISGAALASGSTIVAFRETNGFGNNMFIDNINIQVVYRRDISVTAINRPVNECATNFPPAVLVTNRGIDIVTGFKVAYSIDNVLPPTTTTFTGLNLAPGASQVFNLSPATSSVGAHSIRVYSFDLITNNGVGDQFNGNDTLGRSFNIYGTVNAPLVEGFEGSTFVPANWGFTNPDGSITWSRRANVGNNSSASAWMNNFGYANANGAQDELTTPMIAYSKVDSVYISFDLAARTRKYPGSTQIAIDTLELLITKDCGNTYTTVWRKWGEDLQTINDPNSPTNIAFVPSSLDWKTIKLNISSLAGNTGSNLQAVFRSSSNGDNNVFVDNVNISTLTLPEKLKRDGYLIYPSPFTGTVTIQHYLPPTSLRAVQVFNARGQMVASKQFGNGGANSNETMNLANLAAGVYTFKLLYTNKEIVERVVKTN